MLGTVKAFSSFAADDLTAASTFYRQTLGLRVAVDHGRPLWLEVDGSRGVLVYPKPDHRPASFTVLNFPVDDIDQAVGELTARGVRIQRYPGFKTDDKGIYHAQDHSIAWFTDPAGNGLAVVQEH